MSIFYLTPFYMRTHPGVKLGHLYSVGVPLSSFPAETKKESAFFPLPSTLSINIPPGEMRRAL